MVSQVEWFVVAGDKNSNDGLAEALAARGYGYDSLATITGVPCHDGHKRDFLRIPGSFVALVKRAKKGSDVLKFRFWKRNNPNVDAYPADFVEKERGVRQSPHFKSGAARLAALKAASAATGEDAEPDF